eukprot:9443280-Alexandrium_andersonii.AAC.1
MEENEVPMCFPTVPGFAAIVDTAAGQALMGQKAFENLEAELHAMGLRAVTIEREVPSPQGVGGKAHPLGLRLVPIMIGGVCGVI